MTQLSFTLADIAAECELGTGHYQLDGRSLGMKIIVPPELYSKAPYSSTAYQFMQQLRSAIFEYGVIELPGLPVNRQNYTLAQRSPQEHAYSSNTYMTDLCQSPHQDTPPYPTGFWLDQPRRYFATWVMSDRGIEEFAKTQRTTPNWDINQLHSSLVPSSLAEGWGLLLNQQPGLLLIDNSQGQPLYHARTCNFEAVEENPDYRTDSPMYAFNEPGLLQYIDMLDSKRGTADRNADEVEQVRRWLAEERLP
jgi:hypothetical protein